MNESEKKILALEVELETTQQKFDSLETEYSLYKRSDLNGLITRTIQQFTKTFGYVLIAFFAYKSIEALAGKQTIVNADIAAKIEQGNDFFTYLPVLLSSIGLILGLGGIMYGRHQRKLKEAVTKKYEDDVVRLEKKIHPGRTSSGLTENGNTRPEDV
jgi:hypothetical protein